MKNNSEKQNSVNSSVPKKQRQLFMCQAFNLLVWWIQSMRDCVFFDWGNKGSLIASIWCPRQASGSLGKSFPSGPLSLRVGCELLAVPETAPDVPRQLFLFRTNPISGSLESHMSHGPNCHLFSPITACYLRALAEIPTSLSLGGLVVRAASAPLSRLSPTSPPPLSDPSESWVPILMTSTPPGSMGGETRLYCPWQWAEQNVGSAMETGADHVQMHCQKPLFSEFPWAWEPSIWEVNSSFPSIIIIIIWMLPVYQFLCEAFLVHGLFNAYILGWGKSYLRMLDYFYNVSSFIMVKLNVDLKPSSAETQVLMQQPHNGVGRQRPRCGQPQVGRGLPGTSARVSWGEVCVT